MIKPNLIGVERAAEFLGVTDATVHRWIKAGKLPAYRIAGTKKFRIDADELAGLLRPATVA